MRHFSWIATYGTLCLAVVASVAVFPYTRLPPASFATRKAQEALYLPRGEALEFMSFGYRSPLAQTLWFTTVMYFGRHVQTDRDYTWLMHLCGLVTKLNPRMRHVYEFGGVMLAWEADDPESGLALLDRAVTQFPDYWRLYYIRGIMRLHFLHDDEGARSDFLIGANLPGALPIMAQMAAKKMTHAGSAELAVQFLRGMLESATTESSRNALERSLRDAIFDRDRTVLSQLVADYRERYARFPVSVEELMTAGLLRAVPREPYGGEYRVDSQTGIVSGTSEQAQKRLPIHKTRSPLSETRSKNRSVSP